MELERGVCHLCTDITKVLSPSNSTKYVKLIPQILSNRISESEFQKIQNSIKLCMLCSHKLQLTDEIKKAIKNVKLPQGDGEKLCRICRTNKNLVKVKNDWKFFTERAEDFLGSEDYPAVICIRCFYYFDTVFHFKDNFLHKHPQLSVKSKPSPKTIKSSSDTPKRKSVSISPPSAKKRKIFNDCFTYLQPLSKDSYKVDRQIKKNDKFYKFIPYVNLKGSSTKPPTRRPIIKIRLKKQSKKNEYVSERLFRSDQGPVKLKSRRPIRRNSSPSAKQDDEEVNDTPKVANTSDLAPKRRVSTVFIDLSNDTVEEKSKEVENEASDVEIIEKSDDDDDVDDKVDHDVRSDNIENNDEEKEEEEPKDVEEENEDKENEHEEGRGNEGEEESWHGPQLNGHNKEIYEEKNNGESVEQEISDDGSEYESPEQETGNADPLEISEDDRTKTNLEPGETLTNIQDYLNDSLERKKKRVTFSDEVNID